VRTAAELPWANRRSLYGDWLLERQHQQLYEAGDAENGATELDVVINLSWLKTGKTEELHREIAEFARRRANSEGNSGNHNGCRETTSS